MNNKYKLIMSLGLIVSSLFCVSKSINDAQIMVDKKQSYNPNLELELDDNKLRKINYAENTVGQPYYIGTSTSTYSVYTGSGRKYSLCGTTFFAHDIYENYTQTLTDKSGYKTYSLFYHYGITPGSWIKYGLLTSRPYTTFAWIGIDIYNITTLKSFDGVEIHYAIPTTTTDLKASITNTFGVSGDVSGGYNDKGGKIEGKLGFDFGSSCTYEPKAVAVVDYTVKSNDNNKKDLSTIFLYNPIGKYSVSYHMMGNSIINGAFIVSLRNNNAYRITYKSNTGYKHVNKDSIVFEGKDYEYKDKYNNKDDYKTCIELYTI